VKFDVIRMLIIVPSGQALLRAHAASTAASAGDMLDVVVLLCDEGFPSVLGIMGPGLGFCKCQSSSRGSGCIANVSDLIEEVRSSNLIVTFNHADARAMMWAGVEVAVVVLDGNYTLQPPHPPSPSPSPPSSQRLTDQHSPSPIATAIPLQLFNPAALYSRVRLLQLHRFARDRSYLLLVQSAAPSLSDSQMIESGVRASRNFGRGVAFCGVKCGSPMKPQLWTPISYEWDNRKWISEVHGPYEKSMGWA
jgi:hypothetical protein